MTDTRSSFPLGALAVLQPIGFAIAQILSFCANNVGEVGLGDASRALWIASGSVVAIWLVLLRICGGARLAAFVVSMLAFGFWSVASVAERIGESVGASISGATLGLLLVLIAVVALVARVLRRTERGLQGVYLVADAMAAVSVLIPTLTILTYSQQAAVDASEPASATVEAPVAKTSGGDTTPDIYWFVLDAYGRDDELEEHFGITEGLGARLEAMGFYTAQESRANYLSTLHAIPSAMNFGYIQNLSRRNAITKLSIHALARNSRFARVLKRSGYRIVSYESGIGISRLGQADEHVEPPASLAIGGFEFRPTYFERGLLGLTPIDVFLRQSEALSSYALHRERVLNAFDHVPRLAYSPQPTFAFVHVISPHEPFVFDREGNDISPTHLTYKMDRIFEDPDQPEEPGRVGPRYAQLYADQAVYVADLVVGAVEKILARSPEPPIIIVQGDHGPYGFSPNIRRTRAAIINAYFLPDDGAARLHPSISPVNSGRVILNAYFGTTLPMLDDVTYDASWTYPDRFTLVE